MSRALNMTFLVHVFVSLAFGLLMFLSPTLWTQIAGYTQVDPYITRVLGAALLSLALASWLGYRAHRWEEVRILVELELAFTVMGALALLYSVLFETAPVFIWVPFAVLAVFAVIWGYFLARPHAESTPTLHGSGPAPMAR